MVDVGRHEPKCNCYLLWEVIHIGTPVAAWGRGWRWVPLQGSTARVRFKGSVSIHLNSILYRYKKLEFSRTAQRLQRRVIRVMGFLTDHPYTAVTANIDRVVSNREYSLEVELAEIVDLIGFRNTVNQEEAARALRKKLKYGSKVQQSRSLDLLDFQPIQQFIVIVNYTELQFLG